MPFYRATNFAKYAAANVPGADTDRYSSYMTETAYSERLPREHEGHENDVVSALVATGLVPAAPPVASVHTIDVEYAYPIPTRDRDRALEVVQPWLMERDIYSRGRFGAWRYEVSNQDHSFMQGVEVVNRLAFGTEDDTLNRPDHVNAGAYRTTPAQTPA